MSATIKEEIRCPGQDCGEVFEAELHYSINVQQDPELKELLLAGELNLVACPRCKTLFYAEYFVLYIEPGRELLAYVYPKSCEKDRSQWENKVSMDFRKAQSELADDEKVPYEPVVLFGMDALLHLLEYEELQFDEVAVLESIYRNLGLEVLRIGRAEARKRNIPPLLPVKKGGNTPLKHRVIEGIKVMLQSMPDMDIYRSSLDRIADDSSLNIEDLAETERVPG